MSSQAVATERRPLVTLPPLDVTVAVLAFAVAMAYLEAAVVVYLREALGHGTGDVFPIDLTANARLLGWIEIGREAATLVMITTVGWIAGRSGLERLAWAAVVFGTWDIAYYVWLWAFSGWPPGIGTWDLLFLIPLPWAGPVWAPVTVSLALVGFGLAMAGRCRTAGPPSTSWPDIVLLTVGGLVIIGSFMLNAAVVLDGGVPTEFAWPVFVAGMAIGMVAATRILLAPPRQAPSESLAGKPVIPRA